MPGLIYIISAATCLLCAILLLRAFIQHRGRLLLWSGLCFLGLMLECIMLYLDIIILPTSVDLAVWRKLPGLLALLLLVYGLIWDSK